VNTITLHYELEDLELEDRLTLACGDALITADFTSDGEMIEDSFLIQRIRVGNPARKLSYVDWDHHLAVKIIRALATPAERQKIFLALISKWREEKDAGVLDPID
jgi:hypothetical protein